MRQRVFSATGVAVLALVLGLLGGCSRLGLGRSDTQISDEVRGKIAADASISSKQVTVESNNGVITLAGTVANESERAAAAADAAQVDGVKTVVNNLQVAPTTTTAAAASTTPPPPVAARPTTTARRSSAAPAGPGAITIPEGTTLLVRMIDSIDSERNKPGDTFRASLDAPVSLEGNVIVPKGADVEGRVVEAQSAGHFTGRSQMALELTRLTMNGRAYELQTNQYSREGSSRGKRTAATVGGAAAAGAVIGAIAGGGKGAAIGAAAGAGTGTAVQAMTKGQQIKIPSETVLEFQLKAPLRVARR